MNTISFCAAKVFVRDYFPVRFHFHRSAEPLKSGDWRGSSYAFLLAAHQSRSVWQSNTLGTLLFSHIFDRHETLLSTPIASS